MNRKPGITRYLKRGSSKLGDGSSKMGGSSKMCGKAHYVEIWREMPEETPKRFEAGTFQERDSWQVWGVQRTAFPSLQ